jgi:hypothetical protein
MKDPVFPLEPLTPIKDLDKAYLEHYEADGTDPTKERKYKASVPIMDGTDKFLILHVMYEFNDAAAKRLHYSEGPHYADGFRQCTTGEAKSTWDDVVAEVLTPDHPDDAELPMTMDRYMEAVQLFLKRYFDQTDFEDQKRYLAKVPKPFNKTAAEWRAMLKQAYRYMELFEWAEGKPIFTYNEQITNFLESFPTSYQRAWKSTGRDKFKEGMSALVNFLHDHRVQEDATRTGKFQAGARRTQSNSHRSEGKSKHNGASKKHGNGNGKGSNGESQKNMCRHENHKHEWKDCIYNKNGKNYSKAADEKRIAKLKDKDATKKRKANEGEQHFVNEQPAAKKGKATKKKSKQIKNKNVHFLDDFDETEE